MLHNSSSFLEGSFLQFFEQFQYNVDIASDWTSWKDGKQFGDDLGNVVQKVIIAGWVGHHASQINNNAGAH